jgi:SAM-dependent MidA family methyltransferase
MPALPAPPADAQSASRTLARRIAQRIAAAGGWVGFDAFMQWALYEPGLGYYGGGARKFGAQGDFVTAPELSPIFGACLAAQCAQWFEHTGPRIVEFGAGSGALAAQVLAELRRSGLAEVDYAIVEVSGELRARQRATIEARVPAALARVSWLDEWPARIEGVVLGNELLDAMPARAFRWRDGAVAERGVTVLGEDEAHGARFDWSERAADAAFERRVRALLAGPIAQAGEGWPADYAGEVPEQAVAWVAEAGRRLARGALLLIDYGFPRHEFYHPQRGLGTLMCHYRHHAHGDPFFWPGLQDLTVHVDFTAVAEAGLEAGLDLLGYTSQANLLLNLGLAQRIAETPAEPRLDYARAAQAAFRLVSEAEMGELFKAIAFGRGLPGHATGFARGDRRGRL